MSHMCRHGNLSRKQIQIGTNEISNSNRGGLNGQSLKVFGRSDSESAVNLKKANWLSISEWLIDC